MTSSLPSSLYTAAQVRALDRCAIEVYGSPGYELMSRAGQAAFAVLREQWPAAKTICVLCGVGNNGGDGFVIARLALEAGLAVRVLQLGDAAKLGGDALQASEAWHTAGGVSAPFTTAALEHADVIVDAMLGTGIEREVSGGWRDAIEALNRSPAPVLAVDLPSGLHSDTGTVLGQAVKAQHTISFIGLKRGMFTAQGPDHCGTVHFHDLGVAPAVYSTVAPAARLLQRDAVNRHLGLRPRSSHKGHFGHVLVIGGDYGFAGAALLAAEAAARSGAGLVSVATRSEHTALITAARPELMCHGVERASELQPLLERATVIVVGPGLGRSAWAQRLFSRVLETDLPLVVDADALNLLSQEPLARGNWILTPHPGEAARLLKTAAARIQADRFAALDALVDAYRGVTVLKGAGTLVAMTEGEVQVCAAGNPGMASGGMGDVLSGVIAALLAQGLGLQQAASCGVYLHAAAADMAAVQGERGLLASDLLQPLRILLNPAPEQGPA